MQRIPAKYNHGYTVSDTTSVIFSPNHTRTAVPVVKDTIIIKKVNAFAIKLSASVIVKSSTWINNIIAWNNPKPIATYLVI